MKNLKISIFSVLLTFFASALFIGCGKDDKPYDPTAGYPKDATVRYEVSSTTNNTASVTYTNETGEDTSIESVALPFTKEVKKKVEFAEIFTLLSSIPVRNNESESVRVKVFVDNKLVEDKTASSNSVSVVGQARYQFGQ